MKIQFLYLLIGLFVYLSKCEDIIIPTNYTLSYFNNVDTQKITCKSDSDCPQFSKCVKNDNEKGYVCEFSNFLCPSTIVSYFHNKGKKEDEYCFYVNTEIWNLDEEKMNPSYPKNTKPILKTCLKENAFDITGECTTEKCDKNEDCLSGMCIKNVCIAIDNFYIYRCTGNKNNVKCGKQNGINCYKDDECYSGTCYFNSCNKKKFFKAWTDYIVKSITIVFIIMVINVVIIIICYKFSEVLFEPCVNFYFDKKEKKRKNTNNYELIDSSQSNN